MNALGCLELSALPALALVVLQELALFPASLELLHPLHWVRLSDHGLEVLLLVVELFLHQVRGSDGVHVAAVSALRVWG